ncbi:MAG: aromatic amino acid lyase, partial [Gammaproteobacteria bacterium]
MRIDSPELGFAQFRAALNGPITVELDDASRAALTRCRNTVLSLLEQDEPIYGVNTGFGQLARQRIDEDDLETLQKNIVRSHAAGTAEPLDDSVVRLILLLKIKSLARGFSGVRAELVDALLALVNADVLPVVPRQGSVGASGDLAPLAHLSLVLIGEGKARHRGVELDGAAAMRRAQTAPLQLGPKEGLALLNGTQVSTALVLSGLIEAERNLRAAVLAGALSVDAVLGSDAPFDPRIHLLRGHQAQIDVAAHYRRLLAGSAIRASHAECDRVQDPYSFRCQPQVMGACLEQLRHAAKLMRVEANAVTDNPLVFPEDGAVLSGGNFHAQPVAFAADGIALAVAECGA